MRATDFLERSQWVSQMRMATKTQVEIRSLSTLCGVVWKGVEESSYSVDVGEEISRFISRGLQGIIQGSPKGSFSRIPVIGFSADEAGTAERLKHLQKSLQGETTPASKSPFPFLILRLAAYFRLRRANYEL